MVKGMDLLPSDLQARLVLIGDIEPDLLSELRVTRGWTSVDYRGWIDRVELSSALASSRAGLVVLHPEPNYVAARPTKLFEYMAAGLPVIASDFPIWRQFIDSVGCGLLVNPLDPGSIASAISWVLSHPKEAQEMGERGYTAVQRVYNWERESNRLVKLYASLTQRAQYS